MLRSQHKKRKRSSRFLFHFIHLARARILNPFGLTFTKRCSDAAIIAKQPRPERNGFGFAYTWVFVCTISGSMFTTERKKKYTRSEHACLCFAQP